MSNIRNLLAAALLASAGNAVAASSVDLSVTGAITPSACTPSLSNGGVVDVGKTSAKDLNVETATWLVERSIQMTVTCDAATLMAIEGKDNRAGSHFEDNNPYDFGFGLINGNEKLGGMELTVNNPVADGVAVRTIESEDGITWYRGRVLNRLSMISVADTATLAPIPVREFSSDLKFIPIIAPTKTLTLNNEVAIDGSVTLTVRYL